MKRSGREGKYQGSVSRLPPYFRRHGSYLKLIPIRSSHTLSHVKEDFVTVLEYMVECQGYTKIKNVGTGAAGDKSKRRADTREQDGKQK